MKLMRVGNGSGSAFTDHRRTTQNRKYRSQCKTCGHAIYSDQPARWSVNPIGLCHERCP